MATTHTVDAARQEAFINKVLDHTSGTMTTLLAVIGDRPGSSKILLSLGRQRRASWLPG